MQAVLAKTKKVLTVQELRQAVVEDLRRYGKMTFIGFDNLEYIPANEALNQPICGTVFEIIAGSLTKNGAPKVGGYKTIGDVMAGLGYTEAGAAHRVAHEIGCHCHGPISGYTAARQLEALNRQ